MADNINWCGQCNGTGGCAHYVCRACNGRGFLNSSKTLKELKVEVVNAEGEQAHVTDMKSNIKEWYMNDFPNDELGIKLWNNITFKDLYIALDSYEDIYLFLGVDDSVVRERVFKKLSKIMKIDYISIYNQWLSGEGWRSAK